jgi:hypothetical protein
LTVEALQRWFARRRARRRFKTIQRGVWACARDRRRIPEVARRLGVPAATLETWVAALEPSAGEPDGLPLRLEPRPIAPLRAERSPLRRSRAPWVIPRDPAHLADQVRRMILLLLDLPLAREEPLRASDFIVQLAEAARAGDEAAVEALTPALAEAVESPPEEAPPGPAGVVAGGASRGAPAPQARTPGGEFAAGGALGIQAHKFGAGEASQEQGVVTVEAPAVRTVWVRGSALEKTPRRAEVITQAVKELDEVPEDVWEAEPDLTGQVGPQRPEVATAPQELPATDDLDWGAARAVLDTLCGDPAAAAALEDELAFLASLEILGRRAAEVGQGEADVLVIVRSRL